MGWHAHVPSLRYVEVSVCVHVEHKSSLLLDAWWIAFVQMVS